MLVLTDRVGGAFGRAARRSTTARARGWASPTSTLRDAARGLRERAVIEQLCKRQEVVVDCTKVGSVRRKMRGRRNRRADLKLLIRQRVGQSMTTCQL